MPRRSKSPSRAFRQRLARLEQLESRQLMAVDMQRMAPLPSGDPTLQTQHNGQLFFVPSTNTNQLWMMAPGNSSTPVNVFTASQRIQELESSGGELYFATGPAAASPIDSASLFLYSSPGIASEIDAFAAAGGEDVVPRNLTDVNGTLFFSAYSSQGRELFTGDSAGAVLVKDINPIGSSYPRNLINYNGTLVFTADDASNGEELWKSDGTEAGTVMVQDIMPQEGFYAGVYYPSQPSISSNPTSLTVSGGTLFFSANNGEDRKANSGAIGRELWSYNGTTVSAIDINVDDVDPPHFPGSSNPERLTDVNGTLYFVAEQGQPFSVATGRELFRLDGSSPVLLKNIGPNDTSGDPQNLTAVGSTLYFTANDGAIGRELWKSDGSETGTVLVNDIMPDGGDYFGTFYPSYPSISSDPSGLTNVNGVLYFTANNGQDSRANAGAIGREPWSYDGSALTAFDINPDFIDNWVPGSSNPNSLFNFNDKLYFAADNGTDPRALYRTNERPTFVPFSPVVTNEDASLNVSIFASDLESLDSQSISATSLPSWLTLTDNGSGTATLSGTPTNANVGTTFVTVQVTAPGNAPVTQTLQIDVLNTNDAPVITSTPGNFAATGAVYNYTISTVDDDGDPRTISGSTVPSWLTLVDNGNGTATLSGTPTAGNVGANSVSLQVSDVFRVQNFDGVTAPNLPVGWTTTASGVAAAPWVTSTVFGPNSAFVPNPNNISDNALTSPVIRTSSSSTKLRFENRYEIETGYDGGVLEISINGGGFEDIVTAGGSFEQGGYVFLVDSGYGNPLGGRNAWSGDSGGPVTTIVNLPAAAIGSNVQFRWRIGTDDQVSASGWHIDNIELISPPVTQAFTLTVGTNAAPVIATAGQTVSLPTINEDVTNSTGILVSTLAAISTDANAGALKGIAVTSQNGPGTWQYTLNGTTWTNFDTVSLSAARLLRSNATTRIRFVPNANESGSASFEFRAWDQTQGVAGNTYDIAASGGSTAFSSNFAQGNITVTSVNDAPVLTTTVPILTVITEDVTNPAGTLVSLLVDGVSDADAGAVKGIAVYLLSNSNGKWQYALNGTTWIDFGSPTVSTARLLAADATTRVRFVPNANFNGEVGFWFYAWDQTQGTNGGTANINSRGGSTPYSSATVRASQTIIAANDAPVLAATVPVLTSIAEDVTNPAGTLVSALVGGVSDVDAGAVKGIAVYLLSNSNGTWQYALDGASWVNFDSPTVSAAQLLAADATTRVRFVPNANFNGEVGFWFYAWDRTEGTNGEIANVSLRGGRTAFSSATVRASQTITAVNDAPVLTTTVPILSSIAEDATNPAGTLVSALVSGLSDIDAGAVKGIAVYLLNNTNGTWQYALNGTTWVNFGSPTISAARLLAADATTRIRFVPNANYNGEVGFWFYAWDRTQGASGDTANISARGGMTPYSVATVRASHTITAVNDAPVLATTVPVLTSIAEDVTNPAGTRVSTLVGGVTDADTGAARGIAVYLLSNSNGTWQYTLNGTTWVNFGNPTVSAARLLAADATTRVRFVPNANFNGEVGFWFYAWDRTQGASGDTADVSARGGARPFSVATVRASQTITAVNDAPVIATNGQVISLSLNELRSATGILVSTLTGVSTDVDANALKGIAVTLLTGDSTWQYSLDGTTWINFGTVSRSTARLLKADATTRIRYIPVLNPFDFPTIGFRAWDQTQGTAGSTFNVTASGGSTAFSSNYALGST